jgi:hypothetical protein
MVRGGGDVGIGDETGRIGIVVAIRCEIVGICVRAARRGGAMPITI